MGRVSSSGQPIIHKSASSPLLLALIARLAGWCSALGDLFGNQKKPLSERLSGCNFSVHELRQVNLRKRHYVL